MPTAEITRSERKYPSTDSGSFEFLSGLSEREVLYVASPSHPTYRIEKTISIETKAGPVKFRYVDNRFARPSWFLPLLQRFANLVMLPDNWDGEGARRIDRATINRALSVIEQILPKDAIPPILAPIANSGLQLQWHRDGKYLEVEFNPDRTLGFYYFDEAIGEEQEGVLGNSFTPIAELLRRIR